MDQRGGRQRVRLAFVLHVPARVWPSRGGSCGRRSRERCPGLNALHQGGSTAFLNSVHRRSAMYWFKPFGPRRPSLTGWPVRPRTPTMRAPPTASSMPHPIEQTPQVDGTQRSMDAPSSTWENGPGMSEAIQTNRARALPPAIRRAPPSLADGRAEPLRSQMTSAH